MTGSIKDYTPNFEFIIPEFNITGWHDYLEENFRSIDALFYNLFGINNFKGQWKNATIYNANDVVFVGEDTDYSGRLVKVLVQHTTASTGNFTEFFTSNPSYYELFADASTAQIFAQEAKNWAVKMDDPVEDNLYSSKYYADIVNGLSTEITTLYNIKSDIQNVSLIGAEVVEVSNIKNSVQSVANNETNINTNATNITNINTTATNIASVNTNATNINAINTNASNISDIQNAYSNAQSALNSKNKAQEWATKMNGLVDNIDYSAKYYANQSQTSAELSAQYANDKINQTHITNCITEIPQDIKLELNNGTVTLKAGSKVYVPNGAGVFNTATISSDKTYTYTAENSTRLLMYKQDENYLYSAQIGNCYSGSSAPTNTSTIAYWYDTTNNLIKKTTNGGSTWTANAGTLPLALISVSNGQITSIDQVFNGFGYIGSTIYALPGVKGLIPNGRNEDGSLKNIEFTTNNVLIRTVGNYTSNMYVLLNATGIYCLNTSDIEYKEKENKVYNVSAGWIEYSCICCNLYRTSGKITSFTPKTAFHAADYNDSSTISGWAMPSSRYVNLTLGASGATYTAPANGWFVSSLVTSSQGACWSRIASRLNPASTSSFNNAGWDINCILPVSKNETVDYLYNIQATLVSHNLYFIYAQGSESEAN